ncbi:MAG: proline dehydrogenase family protein [Acidobacteria bacterium]|nr:proline dehydrogenase family protein [Acidobacteriota bacterium]
MSEFKLDFQDIETAFADKSNAELKEKYRLFKMMNSPGLVSFGTKMTQFALSWGLPVSGLIKSTIFHQFCGGETIEECQRTIDKLGGSNIGTILDYSVEGKTEEEDFENTKDEIIKTIKRAHEEKYIPFAVFKVSGIAPLGTLQKVSAGTELTEKGKWKWERIQSRVADLCQYAHSLDQPLFIDAEETWIQKAIDLMVEPAMEKYNQERPLIYTTIQMYRTDGMDILRESHRKALEKGYYYAVKLVRGAYMEKERARAEEMGYPSPIQPDKPATDQNYDAAVAYCLENIDTIAVVNATHNEQSTQQMAQLMEKKKIPRDHPNANFSQLFGMSDNLTYVLAKNGYNVSKYVPYGPVKSAVPYLSRRATENTSVRGMMSRELEMIYRELKRRKSL